eukprot:896151-Prymnesium_polylepis.1
MWFGLSVHARSTQEAGISMGRNVPHAAMRPEIRTAPGRPRGQGGEEALAYRNMIAPLYRRAPFGAG